jgi:hypothetical protein
MHIITSLVLVFSILSLPATVIAGPVPLNHDVSIKPRAPSLNEEPGEDLVARWSNFFPWKKPPPPTELFKFATPHPDHEGNIQLHTVVKYRTGKMGVETSPTVHKYGEGTYSQHAGLYHPKKWTQPLNHPVNQMKMLDFVTTPHPQHLESSQLHSVVRDASGAMSVIDHPGQLIVVPHPTIPEMWVSRPVSGGGPQGPQSIHHS